MIDESHIDGIHGPFLFLDGRFDELFDLLQDHAAIGSELARRLVLAESLAADTWLVEPIGAGAGTAASSAALDGGAPVPPSNATPGDALIEELRR